MASHDLKQLSDHVYYLPGGVNSAIVVNVDGGAVLVDTGGDKDAGRRLRKACEALGVTPLAILNTHAHADHYGGNAYLLGQFDIPVYAPPFEAGIMQYPYLEPVYLFSGAKPPPELLTKWLLAKPSRVDTVLTPGELKLAGLAFDILETSGHAHTHVSVQTDGVLLAADVLFGAEVLEKYPLPFGQDISRQLASAARLRDSNVRILLPGHGAPSENIADLVDHNLATFHRAADAVVEACNSSTTDEVLRQTCASLDISMTDLPRFFLNRCVVLAYLSYLRDEGRVRLELKHNELSWQRQEQP